MTKPLLSAEGGGAREREKRERYALCREQLAALLRGEEDLISRMASTAALLGPAVPRASFVGFYRLAADGESLIVGPYQGPPACLRIALGRGVCGAAAARREPILVPDVREYPEHIACDPLARSELVLPVFDPSGALLAVCDLDSREAAAFDRVDLEELESILRQVFTQG